MKEIRIAIEHALQNSRIRKRYRSTLAIACVVTLSLALVAFGQPAATVENDPDALRSAGIVVGQPDTRSARMPNPTTSSVQGTADSVQEPQNATANLADDEKPQNMPRMLASPRGLQAPSLATQDAPVASGTLSSGHTWSIEGNETDGFTLTIEGEGSMPSSLYSNCPWAQWEANITEAHIGEGVTSLSSYLFAYDCKRLERVSLPGTVETFGSYAFRECPKLKSVNAPASLKTIEYGAFYDCILLESFDFPDGLESIESYAFQHCESLKQAILPDSVTWIGASAFTSCYALETARLPQGIARIPNSMFSNCSALGAIDIPDSVTAIGTSAFSVCSNLSEVNMSANVTSIESSAFTRCSSLTEMPLSPVLQSLGSGAFSSCGFTEVVVPESVTSMDTGVFSGCELLERATLPSSIATIPDYTFNKCPELVSVDYPGNITSVGNYAFSECKKLASFDFPSTLQTIGNYAFRECPLQTIDLPDGLTRIGREAFRGNRSVTSIDLPDSITSIGESTFEECSNLQHLKLPRFLEEIPNRMCYGWTNLHISAWPQTLKSIGDSAFSNCYLSDISLPDTVESIGKNAFSTTNRPHVSSITIPKATTSIGSYALYLNDEIRLEAVELRKIAENAVGYAENVRIVVADSVKVLSREFLTAASAKRIGKLVFEGESVLEIDDLASLTNLPDDLNTIIRQGTYYVDPHGALYRLEDDGAQLAYVPEGVTGYTVPANVPASEEGGDTLPVVGIGANALKNAKDLHEIDFADPGAIARIDSYAMANRPSLASVNGQTTTDGALASFPNATTVGMLPFTNTGLQESADPRQTKDAIRVVSGMELSIQTDAGSNFPAPSDDSEPYRYLTGEYPQVSVTLSNPDNTADKASRVYVRFENNEGSVTNFEPRTEPYNLANQDGTHTYPITFHATDDPCVFYFDIPRVVGAALQFNIVAGYPSPLSSGGDTLIWGMLLDEDELENLDGVVLEPTDQFQRLNWSTQRDEFSNSKSFTSTDTIAVVGDGSGDGKTYVKGLRYSISAKRTNAESSSIGRDQLQCIEYRDVLTLPPGTRWREGLVEAIQAGNWTYASPSSSTGVAVVIDGKMHQLASGWNPSTGGQSYPTLAVEDGEVVMYWRHSATSNSYSLSPVEMGIVYGNSVVEALSPYAEGVYTPFTNTIEATYRYSYSDPYTNVAQAQASVKATEGKLEVNKTNDSNTMNYGSYYEYTLSLSNSGSLPYDGIGTVTDTLPQMHYITADNMETMLLERADCKLVITIANATLCSTTGITRTVTTADGTTATTAGVQENGMGNKYNGMTNVDESELTTNALITLARDEQGRIVVSMHDEAPGSTLPDRAIVIGQDAPSIREALDSLGYVVTYDATYGLVWNFAREDGSLYPLPSGNRIHIALRSSDKSTFMMLDGDVLEEHNDLTKTSRNYMHVYGSNPNEEIGSSHAYWTAVSQREFKLNKVAYLGNRVVGASGSGSKSMAVTAGNTLDYVVSVSSDKPSYGNGGQAHHYEALPLVDHIEGGQILLVPAVPENDSFADRYGLTATEIEGAAYYLVSEPNTYDNVFFGGYWADRIELTRDSGGIDALVYWYFDYTSANTSRTVSYKTLVDPLNIDPDGGFFALGNEAWLNDHQKHRLYAPTFIVGSRVNSDKKIVTHKGDTPDGDELESQSTLKEGDTVTYRFMLRHIGSGSSTVTRATMYDRLPPSTAAHRWTKDDITITYVEGDNVTVVNGDSWDVEDASPSGADADNPDQQYLCWKDDFSMTFVGTAYIYATLKMPEDTPDNPAWSMYGRSYGANPIENTLSVFDFRSQVIHDVQTTTACGLQKGVAETGYMADMVGAYTSRHNYELVLDPTETGREIYVNDCGVRGFVMYYATLFNGGSTRMYLNDLQDRLPQGFTFIGGRGMNGFIPDYDRHYGSTYSYDTGLPEYRNGQREFSWSTYYKNYGDWNTSADYRPVVDATNDSGDLHQKIACIEASFAASDPQLVTFHIENGDDGTLGYDSVRGKYYLAPNEYLTFCYVARTNAYADTEQLANNHIAMPFEDVSGGGVQLDLETELTSWTFDGQRANDGNRSLLDTDEVASAYGYKGGDESTKWLASNVTVERGEPLPGIEKVVEKTTKSNGDVGEDDFADKEDTLNWTVRYYNNGTAPLYDFVLTDVIDDPYRFVGDVCFKVEGPRNFYHDGLYREDSDYSQFKTQREQYSSTALYSGGTGYTDYTGNPFITFTGWDTNEQGRAVATVRAGERGQYNRWGRTDYHITVDGDPVAIPYFVIEFSGGYHGAFGKTRMDTQPGYAIVHLTTTAKGNLQMQVRFSDPRMGIPAGGTGRLKLSTENGTDQYFNKDIFNNAFITPVEDMGWGQVMHGEEAACDIYVSDEQGAFRQVAGARSVHSNAAIPVAYGYFAKSVKSVSQVGDPGNTAASTDARNYIVLPNEETDFRFTNTVLNTTPRNMNKLVIIDNLPEVGDHATFMQDAEEGQQPNDPRNSEYDVAFANDPEMAVIVTHPDGTVADITDSCHIEYSHATAFDSADWNGSPAGKWGSFSTAARSFRVVYDGAVGGPDKLAPEDQIAVQYRATIRTPNPKAGQAAWNSFGYHFRLEGLTAELEAAPKKVGVRVPYVPDVRKRITDSSAQPRQAKHDETFRFLVHEGAPFDADALPGGFSDAQLATLLGNAGRKATFVTLTVEAGKSASNTVRIDDFREFAYDESGGWTETGNPWTWTSGNSYTIVELPLSQEQAKNYYYYGTDYDKTQQGHSFVYDHRVQQLFTAQNRLRDWTASVIKVAEEDATMRLGQAWFGLYSRYSDDAIAEEDFVESGAGDALSQTRYRATQPHVDTSGNAWYLSAIGCTDASGKLNFDALMRDDYLLVELKAPPAVGDMKFGMPSVHEWMLSRPAVEHQVVTAQATVADPTAYELPATGGSGASAFVAGGLALAACALALLRRRAK